MSRASRILLAAACLSVAAAVPAGAQSARATITASATVVEPISFAAGRSTISSARHAIDVTTPVAVRGRAAHVVQVVRGDARPSAVHPRARATDANGATATAYDVRLRVAADERPRAPETVTYVISTVN
jgi:hypothetical protein